MKKLLIGLGVVVLGGVTVTALSYGQNGLRANASRLDAQVKTTLNIEYGDDWDDLLEDAYGNRWADSIEAKYQTSINSVVVDEVARLAKRSLLEDELENKLDKIYGDDWDDLLESVYGDDWDDALRLKYGQAYTSKLEEELNQILATRPELLPLLNDTDDKYDDLDDVNDDKYDDLDDVNDDKYDDLDDVNDDKYND
ncbi:MAG: hypothetical protein ACRCS6_09425, partial [Turicibacter sp.]